MGGVGIHESGSAPGTCVPVTVLPRCVSYSGVLLGVLTIKLNSKILVSAIEG